MGESVRRDQTEYRNVYGPAAPTDPPAVPLPRFAKHAQLQGFPPNWFLGPRGENADVFGEMIVQAIRSNVEFRQSFLPDDGIVITDGIKASPEFQVGLSTLKEIYAELLANLRLDATPYASWRYQGHMLWDTTLPALAGYFATMLHNPNNVTIQASTLTTFLEEMVGWDLCGMLGFPFPELTDRPGIDEVTPHGHLTSGGTVANIEATWAARELKYLPNVVRAALTEEDSPLYWYTDVQKQQIVVETAQGDTRPVVELDQWELLNVRQDSALRLPDVIEALGPPDLPGDRMQLRWRRRDVWELVLGGSANAIGLPGVYAEYLSKEYLTPIGPPVILGPVTWHYSWPKAMAVLGGGTVEPGILPVEVDPIGRMNLVDLRAQLDRAKAARNPVLLVVGVLGSTEESAVDDIAGVLELREEFRAQGLDFNVHVDAAWGGYFASILRRDYEDPGDHNRHGGEAPFVNGFRPPDDPAVVGPGGGDDPSAHHDWAEYDVFVSDHVNRQIRAIRCADSATVDPHKTGYVPYPAGAITYRNGAIRRLITFGAPVIGSGTTAVSVGEFGIEGSKPGAAAASVYTSHAVVRPSHCGHGKLMNASMINTRAFYAELLKLNVSASDFVVVPLVDLLVPGNGAPTDLAWMATSAPGELRAEYERWLAGRDAAPAAIGPLVVAVDALLTDVHAPKHAEISDDVANWLRQVGPDLNIVDYMFNFRTSDGSVNTDLRLLNLFNREIYDALHVPAGEIVDVSLRREKHLADLRALVSKTEIWRNTYGDDFVFPFLQRLGITRFGPGGSTLQDALRSPDVEVRERSQEQLDCYRKLIVMRSVIMDPFLHAPVGVAPGTSYVDAWMTELAAIVEPIAQRYRTQPIDAAATCGN